MDKEILIKKYLTSSLSETEQQNFEKLLESDTDFKEEVELRSVLFADFKVKQKSKMREWANELNEKKTPSLAPSSATNTSTFSTLRRFAALVVVGLLAYFLYTFLVPSTTPLPDYLAERHPSPTVVMGQQESKQQHWDLAITAYRSEKYDLVVEELKKLPSLTDEQRFYLGLSYLYQEPSLAINAIESFEPLFLKSGDFREEALWFVALAYLEKGDKEAAKELLERIVQEDSWNVEKAKEVKNLILKNEVKKLY